MRTRAVSLSLALSAGALSMASAAPAVTIEWVAVGAPGNACDLATGCFGAVPYAYQIAKYEVTNAQYAEFLNAVAKSDPNGLYSTNMSLTSGGITRTGSTGNFSYTVVSGRENLPVAQVSFYDTLRFANWLHNGQPTGAQSNATTEDGAYTITAQGVANNSIARNSGATIVLPSEHEWYKAAYYDALSQSYFKYPIGTDVQPVCTAPGAIPNTANCARVMGSPAFPLGFPTAVGSYTGSPSPMGTFDQAGNVGEWTEGSLSFSRILRGGGFFNDASFAAAVNRGNSSPTIQTAWEGFRVAMIPEPGSCLLVMTGLFGLAYRQRRQGRAPN